MCAAGCNLPCFWRTAIYVIFLYPESYVHSIWAHADELIRMAWMFVFFYFLSFLFEIIWFQEDVCSKKQFVDFITYMQNHVIVVYLIPLGVWKSNCIVYGQYENTYMVDHFIKPHIYSYELVHCCSKSGWQGHVGGYDGIPHWGAP